MAPSAHSTASRIPWQALAPNRFSLDLLDASGRPSHTLHLYLAETDARWRWHITPYKRHEPMQLSRHEGYQRRHLAERALLFALHRVLHPKSHLPTSLPPQEGGISASRQGG